MHLERTVLCFGLAALVVFLRLERPGTHTTRRLLKTDPKPPDFSQGQFQDSTFKRVRAHYGVPDTIFNECFWDISGMKTGGGKSGSLFVKSKCKKFVLKSMTGGDFSGLKKCYGELANFVTGPDHMCLPVYGVLMGKTKYTVGPWVALKQKPSHVTTFDLKGSICDRLRKNWNIGEEFKELNFATIFESIKFDRPKQLNKIMRAVKRTSEFLYPLNLIDYSLIVKVEAGATNNSIGWKPCQGLESRSLKATCILKGVAEPQRCTFHFMVVLDYLNLFTMGKRFERKWKYMKSVGSTKKKECSSQKPNRYAYRFNAGLEYFFPCNALAGSIDKYHGKNSIYRKQLEKVTANIGDMGPTWLNVMGKRTATPYVPPANLGYYPGIAEARNHEEEDGITPLMWVVLVGLGIFMLCSMMCFLYVITRKSRGRRRAPRGKPIRKKPATFPNRKRRRRWSVTSESDSEY